MILAEPVALVPADDDPPSDTGQRQGLRFRLDNIASRARETAPRLDRHRPLHTSPRRLAVIGGTVEVQSAPGMGTSLTGRIPVDAP